MRRWVILNVLLGLIVLLLAVEIVRTWARALPPVEVQPREPAAVAPHGKRDKNKRAGAEKGAQHGEQRPEAMIAAIADKDLFDPSRRPPSEEPRPEPTRETGPPAGLTIVGVRIFGKDREVFVTDATQGGTQGNWQRRLRTGDQVAGYTIKSIESTSVTLTSPSGDHVKMPLTIEKKGAAAAPPPARPTPGRAAAAAAQPPTSPAAGSQANSPAAGVGGRPATPVPPPQPGTPPPAPPGSPSTQHQPGQPQLPAEVRQKLEQLRQNDKTPRLGRKP
jgi:hypothetical protein